MESETEKRTFKGPILFWMGGDCMSRKEQERRKRGRYTLAGFRWPCEGQD